MKARTRDTFQISSWVSNQRSAASSGRGGSPWSRELPDCRLYEWFGLFETDWEDWVIFKCLLVDQCAEIVVFGVAVGELKIGVVFVEPVNGLF